MHWSSPTLDLPVRWKVKEDAGCVSASEDRAVAAAVGRVLRRGARGEYRELVAGAGEFGQPGLHLTQALGEEFGDVAAGRLAAAADVQDLADVFKCEPGGLGLPDERQSVQDGRLVVAVSGRGPGRGWEQALVLPEPDRLGRHPRPAGHLTDLHTAPLEIPADWKL